MTTHADHDHPNTKAARAACRRGKSANALPPMDAETKQRIKAGGPNRKPKRRKEVDPALPHEFDPEIENPKRCYVCRLVKSANVHSEGPRDLGMLFNFGGK